MTYIRALITTARPKQWIKNLFVFAALIFVRDFTDSTKIVLVVAAFGVFCLASSTVYVLNDIADIERDRLHPTKKLRPLASGAMSVRAAWMSVVVGVTLALGAAIMLSPLFGVIIAAYIVLNVLYSGWLKKVVILDVMCVALGFVLRVIGGAIAISVSFSPWLIFCTFFLTVFLAMSKRKSELLLLGEHQSRAVLSQYSLRFIDQMNTIVLPMTLITYTFYTFSSEHSNWFMLTVPIVMYGLFRYLYIVENKQYHNDGPADDVLSDRPLQAAIVAWLLLSVVILMYFQ